MKVLLIVPDVGRYGGTTRFLERLLDIHVRPGIITTLLVPTGQCHDGLVAIAARYGVTLVQSLSRTLPDTPPFFTPFFDFLFSWTTVRLHRPDLIVVSTADPGRMSIALYFPFPVLYILHSIPEKRFRLFPRWFLKIGSLLHNRFVTVSRAAADAISETMGIPRTHIEVVHNSCSLVLRGTKNSNRSVVLTVGHVVEYKNPWFWLDIACRVLTEYPDTMFIWLGDGELLEPLRDRVLELSLEKRIMWLGYVEDPSLWYQKASVYLQPSRRESHGIAVLEAMAHGLPCVVADTGGLPESVIDGETGYVRPLADPVSFTAAVMGLLGDPGLCKRMGEAGRQRVENNFSEELQEEKLMVLYRSLVQQKEG